jgi:hypothetical protein
MMKSINNTFKAAKNRPLMTLAIVGGAYYLYSRSGMELIPSASAEAAPSAPPLSTYSYDSYAPVRNQPYSDHMHMFGNTDSLDANFYGF